MKNFIIPALFIIFLFFHSLNAQETVQVSPSNRVKIFNKVWKTINEKYYDPNFNGVDWKNVRESYSPRIASAKTDIEFYALVKRMVGELKDIHTVFRSPAEVNAGNQRVGVGLWISEAEGKPVIFAVDADSEAAAKGIKPGMILTAVDGRDTSEILAEIRGRIKSSSSNAVNRIAYGNLLRGAENTNVTLSLIEPDGQAREITLTRRVISTPNSETDFVSNRLPTEIGYIRFDEFNSPALKKYKKALTDLKDTKGLIIDLRYNRGGSHFVLEEIAEPLFVEKVSFGTIKTRTGKMPKFLGISLLDKETIVGGKSKQPYAAPIIILTSSYSASSAEHFAAGLQESGRAKILGTQTCGCMLGVIGKSKIGGGELYVSQLDFLTAKGKRIEGIGVTPDIAIAPAISDVREGFIQAVIEAQKLLNPNFTWRQSHAGN